MMLEKGEVTYYAAKDTSVKLWNEEQYQQEHIYNKLWTEK